MDKKRVWDNFIPEQDINVYAKAGFGKKSALGNRPAILVIDVQYRTVGEYSEPILESMDKYPTSCGENGWKAVSKIRELIDKAREKSCPIIYAVVERKDAFDAGKWTEKLATITDDIHMTGNRGTQIVNEIAPKPGDVVISKRYASAFFGTPLVTHLNNLNVNTLIVTGATTSGCVRASVSDAFSYGYYVALDEEAVFDRGVVSHAINLFDMNQKYANVMFHTEILAYLDTLVSGRE